MFEFLMKHHNKSQENSTNYKSEKKEQKNNTSEYNENAIENQINEVLNKIEKNHHQLLNEQMVVHLHQHAKKLDKNLKDKQLSNEQLNQIQQIINDKQITDFEKSNLNVNHKLDEKFYHPNLGTKLKDGALAALIGAGTGGAFFLGEQALSRFTRVGSFIPGAIKSLFSGVENEVFGGLAVALGASVSYALYKSLTEDGGAKVDEEDFAKELNKNSKLGKIVLAKCQALAKEFIKLFYYRELLLFDDNVRADFIRMLLKKDQDNYNNKLAKEEYNNNKLYYDTLIESYFIDRTNILINKSFEEIYQAQNITIKQEEDSWLSKMWHQHFDKPEARALCTQQIQLDFMQTCTDFLIAKRDEPKYKNPIFRASVVGLTAGTLAVGALVVAGIVASGPIGWGIIGAVGLALLVGYGAYKIIKKIKKRTKAERDELTEIINEMNKQFVDLKKKLKYKKKTTKSTIIKLNVFKNIDKKHWWNVFKSKEKVALGSVNAWLREYAHRYRHSKLIEIDLKDDQLKEIIKNAAIQTHEMVEALNAFRESENKISNEKLSRFIADTTEYITKESVNFSEMDRNFALKKSYREQVLEIIAHSNKTELNQIPEELQKLYVNDLGGHLSDMVYALQVAKVSLPDEKEKNENNINNVPLLTAMQKIVQGINNNEDIFSGDATYRKYMGYQTKDVNYSLLTKEEVQKRLYASFEFLCSLNKCQQLDKNELSLNDKIIYSDAFLLYRSLLFKQLANMCDPNSSLVSVDIQDTIKETVNEYFGFNPESLFNDMASDGLLSHKDKGKEIARSDNMETIHLGDLQNVSRLMLLDVASESNQLSFRSVLNNRMKQNKENKIVKTANSIDDLEVLCSNKMDVLFDKNYLVTPADNLANQVSQYIDNSKKFLDDYINNDAILKELNIGVAYQIQMRNQLVRLMLEIIWKFSGQAPFNPEVKNAGVLLNTFAKLYSFYQEQNYITYLNKELPEAQLINHFGQEYLKLISPQEKEDNKENVEVSIEEIQKFADVKIENLGKIADLANKYNAKKLQEKENSGNEGRFLQEKIFVNSHLSLFGPNPKQQDKEQNGKVIVQAMKKI